MKAALVLIGAFFYAGIATGQQPPTTYKYDPLELQRKAAWFTGGMLGFMGDACNLYSKQQSSDMKRLQRKGAIAAGLTGNEFDDLYAKGAKEASAQWSLASPDEQYRECEKARKLVGSGSP